MILRRRCGASDCLAWLVVVGIGAVVFVVSSIVYGTRTESPSLPAVVQQVLPAGRCLCQQSTTFHCESCLECAARPAVAGNATQAQETWEFDHGRDGTNYGLDDEQCAAAFPGLFEDLERAKNFRRGRGAVTPADLSSFALSKGMVRAMVHDGQVRKPPPRAALT
jgi:ferredoxin-like protein FixX